MHGVGAQYLIGGPPPPGNLLPPLRDPIFLGDPLRLLEDVLCLLRDWFDRPASGVALLPVIVHRPPALYVEANRLEPQHTLFNLLLFFNLLLVGSVGSLRHFMFHFKLLLAPSRSKSFIG